MTGSARTPSAPPGREGAGPAASSAPGCPQTLGRSLAKRLGWVLRAFVFFVCLLDGLFYFDLSARCLRLFSGSIFLVVCLFVFPADLQKVYFLAADSRVIGSPRAGFCSSPHSCWGKSCVFYLFYLTSLRFELRGVMIYTAPALPASAGDFGGRNTRGLPWGPINSDTRWE